MHLFLKIVYQKNPFKIVLKIRDNLYIIFDTLCFQLYIKKSRLIIFFKYYSLNREKTHENIFHEYILKHYLKKYLI